MAIEINRNETNDMDNKLFGNRKLLSFMLWGKYVECRDQESPFSVVCLGDYYGYEVGHVYMDLRYDSTIHPSCYTNLTWGEFYRWYGLFDWELQGSPEKESVCFDEKEYVRSLEDIVLNKDRIDNNPEKLRKIGTH